MTSDQGAYEAYLDPIRRHVCAVCLDGRGDGSCGLRGRLCAVEAHLPQVVEAITTVESSQMDDYVRVIESQVCGICENRDPNGDCRTRDLGECALATYLYLMVDAVDEVRASARGMTDAAAEEDRPSRCASSVHEVLDLGIELPRWHQFGSDTCGVLPGRT